MYNRNIIIQQRIGCTQCLPDLLHLQQQKVLILIVVFVSLKITSNTIRIQQLVFLKNYVFKHFDTETSVIIKTLKIN